ncbi:M61 family metallopeptidase [Variovorax saccharolyticus]|uniref:M61 family metallopeptidase n=1 Tax=Variovorax saccharolyticus TaxID=3053516 RepID=UPI002577B46B|nr:MULTISPECIES: peptidase M61 [unclassified Variovorax]MDM0020536.1 peptidase M61 [Variovorax sp. J22R187]MDM0025907.1 peptidase M61 [Variovorax sp. J31P216]
MATPAVHCRVECADRKAHLFAITLTIAEPAALQRVALAAWIPGSYLLREFSKNLQQLRAQQGRRKLAVRQLDKASWEIDCTPAKPLVLRYEICAYDNSVRTAWLDADRGFFNGTSVCLQVEGQVDAAHLLEVVAPPAAAGDARWSCATALKPARIDRHGFGSYLAAHYDELADSPVEMGPFWSAEFEACGVPHRFVVAGATASFDGERLIADTRAICEAQMRFWHGDKVGKRGGPKPPHDRYVFMLNAVDDGYGGLEHRHSTVLICTRRDLPQLGARKQPEGYTTLLGLVSHEYFHTWNVKRLRPVEFARYDYARENYTGLLWFFEGFTSYYDDLLLRRAGRIDDATYLRLVNKTINQVQQTPGRQVQSVAQASFDAWIKYYRQDEQTPNATVSYYTKGALVAMCFDLTLRSEGKGTLDDVMRLLWQQTGGGPIAEADIAAALEVIGGRSFAAEIASWVHSTDELPLSDLLRAHGVAALDDPAQRAQELGLRVAETGGSVQVKVVLRGGAAEQAGFSANDEWIGIELPAVKGRAAQGWRLTRLDDLALYLGPLRKATALVARDRRLLRLPLALPAAVTTWRLFAQDPAKMAAWLHPQ